MLKNKLFTGHLVLIFALLASMSLTFGSATDIQAATFNIPDGDVDGLIDALNAANQKQNADTINLASGGTYILNTPSSQGGPDGPTGLPSITSKIKINGNGATIQRSDAANMPDFRVFHVDTGGQLTLNKVTINNGRATGGSPAQDGGGIFIRHGAKVVLKETTVTNNFSALLGGGISNDGDLQIRNNSSIRMNTAVDGGGIFNGFNGKLKITETTFSENSAEFGGAIFNDNGGEATITRNTLIINNTAVRWGGGIANVTFGGGLDAGTILTVRQSTVTGNSASVGGGIFTNVGRTTLRNITSTNNSADEGGGIYNEAQLTLSNGIVNGNAANSNGGGFNNAGDATVRNSVITANIATSGGGIFNSGSLTLKNTFNQNNIPNNCAGTCS